MESQAAQKQHVKISFQLQDENKLIIEDIDLDNLRIVIKNFLSIKDFAVPLIDRTGVSQIMKHINSILNYNFLKFIFL